MRYEHQKDGGTEGGPEYSRLVDNNSVVKTPHEAAVGQETRIPVRIFQSVFMPYGDLITTL